MTKYDTTKSENDKFFEKPRKPIIPPYKPYFIKFKDGTNATVFAGELKLYHEVIYFGF